MDSIDAKQIIQAFDDCLIYVYGQRYARDNPHKSDMETATQWVKDGLTRDVSCFVFYKEMSWMHEKFLHWSNYQDRKLIPHSLKVFNENIEYAIQRMKTDGEVDEWEKVMSSWRARCKGWLKNPAFWRIECWGPEPFKQGCRVPKSVLADLRKRANA